MTQTGLTEGRLWSFMRTVLEHGGAIQQDFAAGKFASYEHYAARVDEAARERAELFEKAFSPPPLQGQETLGAEFEAVWDANAADIYEP